MSILDDSQPVMDHKLPSTCLARVYLVESLQKNGLCWKFCAQAAPEVPRLANHWLSQALSAFATLLTPVSYPCLFEGSRYTDASVSLGLVIFLIQSWPSFHNSFFNDGRLTSLVFDILKFWSITTMTMATLAHLFLFPVIEPLFINGEIITTPNSDNFALLAACLATPTQLTSCNHVFGIIMKEAHKSVISLHHVTTVPIPTFNKFVALYVLCKL